MLVNHAPQGLRAACIRLPGGAAGIFKTTRLMAEFASRYKLDPDIIARARTIVQLSPPKHGPREVGALFAFVRNAIRYVGDVHGTETLATPDKTLALRSGDCDDKALLLATLLEAIGYEARFVVTGYHEPGVYEHVYVTVLIPEAGWLPMDPSDHNPIGWEPPDPVAYYEQEIPI